MKLRIGNKAAVSAYGQKYPRKMLEVLDEDDAVVAYIQPGIKLAFAPPPSPPEKASKKKYSPPKVSKISKKTAQAKLSKKRVG